MFMSWLRRVIRRECEAVRAAERERAKDLRRLAIDMGLEPPYRPAVTGLGIHGSGRSPQRFHDDFEMAVRDAVKDILSSGVLKLDVHKDGVLAKIIDARKAAFESEAISMKAGPVRKLIFADGRTVEYHCDVDAKEARSLLEEQTDLLQKIAAQIFKSEIPPAGQ